MAKKERPPRRGLLDRALRMGEAKEFKQHESRVEAINAVEPEMELLSDEEIKAEADALRERAKGGEKLDDLIPEAFALTREAARRTLGQRHYDVQMIGGMILHNGLDRRDEDGRGQDPHRDHRRVPEHARRRERPRRHGQRLSGAPRRRVDEACLRRARGDGLSDPGRGRPAGAPREVRERRHLRHELRVRIRLPARQHGRLARGVRPARPRLRDRRRGRQHPDRRGADPADHLGQARAGRGPLLHVRPPGEDD